MEPASVYRKYNIVVLLDVFFVLVFSFPFLPSLDTQHRCTFSSDWTGFGVQSCCAPMYLWASQLDGKIDTWFGG